MCIRDRLIGDDIADRSIHFLERIAGADQNVAEGRNTAGAGHGVFIPRTAAVGGAIEVELQAFVAAVLCGLGDPEVAALQVVVKALVRDLVPLDSRRCLLYTSRCV